MLVPENGLSCKVVKDREENAPDLDNCGETTTLVTLREKITLAFGNPSGKSYTKWEKPCGEIGGGATGSP